MLMLHCGTINQSQNHHFAIGFIHVPTNIHVLCFLGTQLNYISQFPLQVGGTM